jgi:CPA1 family monovalent cation:H+ antiporter
MLTLSSVLAMFSLLAIASGLFFVAKRVTIPYTVLLVLVGLLLVPIVSIPELKDSVGFLDDMILTPELLFYIFLPVLIFESAFNMKIRQMVESAWSIGLLSVLGLVVSSVVIAGALYFILPFVGLDIPFIVALLFGAIISATDPVAVLALFKDYGAPKRLSLIFEGESLFNDGTAVALFLVILSVAQHGFHGASTVLDGFLMFIVMVGSGIIIGLFLASLFSMALRYTRSNEFVTVTLLIISAHLVFIISEAINQHGLLGLHFHVSPIIATTVAALFLGNYARLILLPRTDRYLTQTIELVAFIANSLVFILAGMLFASTNVNIEELWLPILITVIVVAIARAVSVYAIITPLNASGREAKIPGSWQKLLSWGSLRGALAIIIVLLIPADLTVSGWTLEYSVRDFVLALTIGCILATLFIKAPTIGPLIRKYKLSEPRAIDQAHEVDMGVYYLLTEQSRFASQKTRGFVRDTEYQILKDQLADREKEAYVRRDSLLDAHGIKLFEQSLHLSAIDIEEHYLQDLYVNEEVSERVYRQIKGKLALQREKIEHAQHEDINPALHTDRKDIFDRLVAFVQSPFSKKSVGHDPSERLEYYRAQMIIARKSLKTLDEMQTLYDKPVFIPEAYEKVVERYTKYKNQSAAKLDKLLETHSAELSSYMRILAGRSLRSSGHRAISYLRTRGIATEANSHEIESRYSVSSVRSE